ncbi:hypothetical protein Y1Q_0011247 [Alligator mississippiensis]|uniref:Uncharacterized protein n=1 Tax=Alligator mississippiensis TaxID=8496 RepID=A0A151N7X0_ALLMI|nr:hypothetical protein Y1Q_0011247 [Alligator mississippiensis]
MLQLAPGHWGQRKLPAAYPQQPAQTWQVLQCITWQHRDSCTKALKAGMGALMASSPMLDSTTQGASWLQEETGKVVVLWGKVEVQWQFTWGGCSNTHIYEGLSGWMQECGYDWSVQQCHIKVKAFWAQWVSISDHKGSARNRIKKSSETPLVIGVGSIEFLLRRKNYEEYYMYIEIRVPGHLTSWPAEPVTCCCLTTRLRVDHDQVMGLHY